MTRPSGVALILGALGALAGAAPALATDDAGSFQADEVGGLRVQQLKAARNALRAEPALRPTPRADCGPGDMPETGIQGRVPLKDHQSGRAKKGYTCNTRLVGSYGRASTSGTVGGFKVERYVDRSGRSCAYYDTTLLYPTNIFDSMSGVNVMDMSDPRKPRRTATLTTPAMLSPHESLVANQKRGLLVAVTGSPVFYPGLVDVYDISEDCRYPKLRSTTPLGVFGHESGMAPDGRTFYSASPGSETVVALDLDNPSLPRILWVGRYDSHGLSIRGDGKRAYLAGIDSGLIILDTSQIQARVPSPTVREVARLTWRSMSIPQNAIPVTIDGRPYVVEIDEFGAQSEVGAGRIIDVGDERRPRVVSNLRLAVHQPENFEAQADDPGARNPLGSYAGHYCNVPRRTDPGIVACGYLLSGLRVFDIRDPHRPREVAYFNSPLATRELPEDLGESNWAMASPTFAPERREVWYTDGFNGFFAVRLREEIWSGGPNCLSARSPIGPRNIGRIRLGRTRRGLSRLRVKPVRRTRHSYRYCVRGRPSARVTAVFNRRGRGGRARLITTTARGHGNRRVRVRSSARRFRRAYPRRRRVARGLYRAGPGSPRLFGVRRGRVRFIAVADRRLIRNRRALRRYLRRAGVR